MHNSLDPKRA